jgi:hypothetical protein
MLILTFFYLPQMVAWVNSHITQSMRGIGGAHEELAPLSPIGNLRGHVCSGVVIIRLLEQLLQMVVPFYHLQPKTLFDVMQNCTIALRVIAEQSYEQLGGVAPRDIVNADRVSAATR